MERAGEFVETLYRALTEGDVEWFRHRLRGDPADVHIGITDDYWSSADELLAALARQFAEVAITWTGGERLVTDLGDVVLVVDRPTLRFDDGSEIPTRLTLVLVRADGTWQLAHSHLSTGSE